MFHQHRRAPGHAGRVWALLMQEPPDLQSDVAMNVVMLVLTHLTGLEEEDCRTGTCPKSRTSSTCRRSQSTRTHSSSSAYERRPKITATLSSNPKTTRRAAQKTGRRSKGGGGRQETRRGRAAAGRGGREEEGRSQGIEEAKGEGEDRATETGGKVYD